MKKHLLLVIPILAALTLAGCKKDVTPVNSTLSIKTLNITSGDTIAVPGNVTFNVSIADDNYALSTLEISAALEDGTVIASESIRTTGNSVDLTDQILEIPFCAGMDAGASLGVTFKAINVDGESVVQSEILSIKRPSLPSELYMTVGDRVYTMAQDDTDSYLYSTKETDGFESAVTATISTASDLSEASYIWGASGTTNLGKICSISDSGIEISYPSVMVDNYTFNALTFEVKAVGQEFDVSVNGKALTPSSGLLYANVSFTKDAQFEITGIADMDSAWNRDFFSYEDGKFTFLRESGSYDVYYSPKYNYIWVVNMDAVAPECLWVIGHGFTCATEWNTDYASGGWSNTDVLQMGYAVRIADERYQCSMYLNNEHEWGTFEFEVYSDRQWNKTNGFCGISLSGDTRGVKLNGAADGKPGLTSDSGFHPGYYTIVFDNATGDINLTRISPWQDTGGTSMSINGTTLESDPSFYYATIDFTKGEEVTFSGFDDIAEAYNRDFFTYQDGKYYFSAESGSWTVQYYPKYDYIWVFNNDLSFPDCIYILGSGKMSCPNYDDSDTSAMWDDVAYTRSAPYYCVAPKIDENTYQATMSMSTYNHDWRVLVELYSDLNWGQDGVTPLSLGGSAAARFYLDGTYLRGVDETEDPFVKGYYQFTFTKGGAGLDISVTKVE